MPSQAIKDDASQFWRRDDEYLETISVVACALGVTVTLMNKVPVARRKVGKKEYYRKGHILAWIAGPAGAPGGLWKRLQAESERTAVRTRAREPKDGRFNYQPWDICSASVRELWFKEELKASGCTEKEILRLRRRAKLDDLPFSQDAVRAFVFSLLNGELEP